jgi:hypothetical protein
MKQDSEEERYSPPGKDDAGNNPENEDYYFNENGLLTFTEKFLLKRGYCCGNGCRHCPYNYEAVPEPKKSALRKARENNSTDGIK